MPSIDDDARAILQLYEQSVRALLEDHRVATVAALDQAAVNLKHALARDARVSIGFVGEAQVGKSSLINAIIGRRALPAGGIGPLTAQATRVMFAEENGLDVQYHGREVLNQVVFSVRGHLARRGELRAAGEELPPSVRAGVDDEPPRPNEAPEDAARRTSEKNEYMLKQLDALLSEAGRLAGASRPLLLDAARAILGQEPYGPATELDPFRHRIAEIAACLGTTERLTETQLGDRRAFDTALRDRAAGWRSSLIERLHLSLHVDALSNMTLVDLPGIGTSGDPAGRLAADYVTTEGAALVLVTRNNGIPESLADLLESTNVVTKLLFGGTEHVDPVHVVLAVTHLDDVVREQYARACEEAAASGDALPTPDDLFQRSAADMERKLREQLRDHLLHSSAFEDLDDAQRSRRRETIEALCRKMDVICVAAPDFTNLSAGLRNLALLESLESTGVPQMRSALEALVARARDGRTTAVRGAFEELRTGIEQHIVSVLHMYEEGGGRATGEWARFRDAVGQALTGLEPEMLAHHAWVVAQLRGVIPERIKLLCSKAAQVGARKLESLRRKGGDLHWASLNAALKRDGVWERRELNYPLALTRAIVDGIATEWEPMIIDEIRSTIKALADRDVLLVERLCEVAQAHDGRIVADAHIEAQKEILRQQSRGCVRWTRDRLEEMNKDVLEKLSKVIERPIGKACERARDTGDNYGRGASDRILQAFHDGGTRAIEEAQSTAADLLGRYYEQLFNELEREYLSQHHDPLKAAYEAMTSEEFERARRSDAQRRRTVIPKLETALSAARQLSEAVTS